MRPTLVPVLLLAAASRLTAADPADAKALRGALRDGAESSLGTSGARLFRGAPEWNAFRERLGSFGWSEPADSPLTAVDFTRDMIACVFHYGDTTESFTVRKCAEGELEIGMSYIIQKAGERPARDWHFICVPVPRAPSLKVSVLTFHPTSTGPHPTLEKANLEWTATLDGDAVGGLRASISAPATVKPGADIPVTFTLRFTDPCAGEGGRFASPTPSASVWDGKYSNGYRNHAFLVTTPDGKSHLFRPEVIHDWDKNAPHLVEITKDKPYELPEWREGETAKSLKKLGLDTTAPGVYRITGVYMESPIEGADGKEEGKAWRGEVFANTVEVEVK